MNKYKKMTTKTIHDIMRCFLEIEEFSLTRDTQIKIVTRCITLLKERDKLKNNIKFLSEYNKTIKKDNQGMISHECH